MADSRLGAIVEFNTALSISALTRPADTTAYAAGDVISDATGDAHFTFAESLRPGNKKSHLSGSIATVRLHSSANVATKLDAELWLFHTDIADVADNAAFAPTDAEALTLVGIISFATANWKEGNAGADAAGNAVIEARNLGLALRGASPTLYGQLVARNAYIPVSGEIFTCELIISQD